MLKDVIGYLSQLSGPLMAPRLQFSLNPYQHRRCRESVHFSTQSGHRQGIVLRAWLYSLGISAAKECRVFVTRICHEGKPLEEELSQLTWTDVEESQAFGARTIYPGVRNGVYVDMCSATEDGIFLVASQKFRRGYHGYDESGTYTLRIETRTTDFSSQAWVQLEVLYDKDSWRSLSLKSARGRRPLLRLPMQWNWSKQLGTRPLEID